MLDTQTPTVEFPVSSSTDSASSLDSTTHVPATTRAPPSTSMVRKTKKICVTEIYTEPNTVATETETPVIRETAFKNEAVGFGGECLLGLLGRQLCVANIHNIQPIPVPSTQHLLGTSQKLSASSASIDSALALKKASRVRSS